MGKDGPVLGRSEENTLAQGSLMGRPYPILDHLKWKYASALENLEGEGEAQPLEHWSEGRHSLSGGPEKPLRG